MIHILINDFVWLFILIGRDEKEKIINQLLLIYFVKLHVTNVTRVVEREIWGLWSWGEITLITDAK